MKHLVALALLLALMLAACGGNAGSTQTSSNPGTGTWVESLTTTSGQQLGSFTFDLTQNNITLTGSNMDFASMGSLSGCFGTGAVMNGQMGQGMTNGGTMSMTMSWTPQGSTATNTMVMQGTMANGMSAGSGAFVLTGQTSGCTSQTGSFTLNPEPA